MLNFNFHTWHQQSTTVKSGVARCCCFQRLTLWFLLNSLNWYVSAKQPAACLSWALFMRAGPQTSDTPIRRSRWRRSRPSRTWTTTQHWGWQLARRVAGCGGTEATSQTTSWTEGRVTDYGVFGSAGTGIVDCNEETLKGKDFQQLQWFKYICAWMKTSYHCHHQKTRNIATNLSLCRAKVAQRKPGYYKVAKLLIG